MKKFFERSKLWVIAFLAWVVVQFIGHSVRLKVVGYENAQKLVDGDEGFIIAVWHGRTLLPLHHCRGMGIWAITSLSRDGEIQTRLVTRLGFRTIRGSSRRGGMKAALMACKRLKEGDILSITPDGPVGPTRVVQDGTVYLARRAECPVVPLGVSARPAKLMKSWDSYLIPMPFARAAIVFGEPVAVSAEMDDEEARGLIKDALDEVQKKAQDLVREGC